MVDAQPEGRAVGLAKAKGPKILIGQHCKL